MSKYSVGDTVKVTGIHAEVISHQGKIAKITEIKRTSEDSCDDHYFLKGVGGYFHDDEIELVEKEKSSVGYFETKATELGKLVDTKQNAYGDSFSKAFDLMKIYLQNYKNEADNTYTIPESLLQHILLQVRIIDKQNRIFSNPDGDLMQENPYADVGGYSLLGMKMCERNS